MNELATDGAQMNTDTADKPPVVLICVESVPHLWLILLAAQELLPGRPAKFRKSSGKSGLNRSRAPA